MATQTNSLPGDSATDPGTAAPTAVAEHHRRQPPDDHLCTCGQLRDDCVRDTIRALWDLPARR